MLILFMFQENHWRYQTQMEVFFNIDLLDKKNEKNLCTYLILLSYSVPLKILKKTSKTRNYFIAEFYRDKMEDFNKN